MCMHYRQNVRRAAMMCESEVQAVIQWHVVKW